MAIDTLAKRRAALRGFRKNLKPDGAIDNVNRHHLLGRYYLETTALSLLTRPCVTMSDMSVVLSGSERSVALTGANRSIAVAGEVLGCVE